MEESISLPKACVVAGFGGMAPTIAKIASALVADPTMPLPGTGMLVALALWFTVGAILALGLKERHVRNALLLGIAAPGIVTNITAGLDDKKVAGSRLSSISLISSATAQSNNPPAVDERKLVKFSTELGASHYNPASPISVYVEKKNQPGKLTPIGSVYAGRETFLPVPADAKSIVFQAGDRTAKVDVPAKPEYSVQLNVATKTTFKSDFLWALGFNREGQVSGLKPEIEHGPTP